MRLSLAKFSYHSYDLIINWCHRAINWIFNFETISIRCLHFCVLCFILRSAFMHAHILTSTSDICRSKTIHNAITFNRFFLFNFRLKCMMGNNQTLFQINRWTVFVPSPNSAGGLCSTWHNTDTGKKVNIYYNYHLTLFIYKGEAKNGSNWTGFHWRTKCIWFVVWCMYLSKQDLQKNVQKMFTKYFSESFWKSVSISMLLSFSLSVCINSVFLSSHSLLFFLFG